MTRPNLDKRPGEVSAMFDRIASHYDLLNDVLSVGQLRWWRRVVARAVAARPRERVLDLAAGTGTSSRTFTMAGAGCVACDFSLGMLQVGRRRLRSAARTSPHNGTAPPTDRPGPVRFVAGDATALPFGDEAFDAVTISFGLRNVADTGAALAEMRRVTRPGGRLVICEFGHLAWPPADRAYEAYLARALPAVARRLVSNPAAYEYLAESIKDWPPQPELARQIAAAGWSGVRWRDLSLGIVAVHTAHRPAPSGT